MGHEIVYCADCGKRLLDDDFQRGEAHVLDSRPFCTQCVPAPAVPPPAPKERATDRRLTPPSTKRVGSSARHAKIVARPAEAKSRTMMIAIGVGAGVVLVLVILVAALSSGKSEPPSPAAARPSDPPVAAPKPAPRPATDPGLEAMKRLESVAGGPDPDATLQACDEARRLLKGAPQERRIDEIERKALAARRERSRERELETALSEAKRMEEADPEFLKSAEVEGMLGAALRQAGARAAEVQKRLDDYRARAGAAAEKRGKGPFALDGQGYVLNWLILGPFPNADDKGLSADFLKGEAAHRAKEGLEVERPDGTKARWGLHASTAPRVRFHEAPHLGVREGQPNLVCYAACKVMVDADQDLVLRAGSDDGMALWLDGREIGRVHEHRPATPDQETYPVRLAKGLHTILVKVEQGEVHFEFLLRVTLPDGALPAGIRIWN